MKLNVLERVTLMSILPSESNFTTLKIVRELQSDLGFNEEELKRYKIRQEGSQMFWDPEEDVKEQKDIKIGEKAADIIVGALKELDSSKKLSQQHLSLYEKFIKVE